MGAGIYKGGEEKKKENRLLHHKVAALSTAVTRPVSDRTGSKQQTIQLLLQTPARLSEEQHLLWSQTRPRLHADDEPGSEEHRACRFRR